MNIVAHCWGSVAWTWNLLSLQALILRRPNHALDHLRQYRNHQGLRLVSRQLAMHFGTSLEPRAVRLVGPVSDLLLDIWGCLINVA
jgi:hypothetical protein